MNCPGCGTAEMAAERYDGNYGTAVHIDVCHACNGIWFDGRESMSLAPGSTLKLFKSMHDRQAHARAALEDQKACPRCQGALQESQDLVRSTRFTYFRCESHGRFITLFQWMREKSLVRAPTAKELAELRAQVKVVNCSNCGAPVTLEQTVTCGHCQAPISILATDTIEATLRSLHKKELDRNTFKPEKLAEAMMVKHQVEAQYRKEAIADSLRYGRRRSGFGFSADLVGVGLGLLFDALID